MNELVNSKSPYLLSHKDNPIFWKLWAPENLELAKKLDKPIFLSIGYFSCHWCHVMAREVFEDHQVAKMLNDNFICIKVDREENPDVDNFYIQALGILQNGNAGWPANLFLTPDLKPFFGFTYLPKQNFIKICLKISQMWQTDKEEILEYADKIYKYLSTNYLDFVSTVSSKILEPNNLEEKLYVMDKSIYGNLDSRGGFSFAPKFPPHQLLEYLLFRFQDTPSKYVFECLDRTLSFMIMGGMYDVVDGGFCRYSVDENWMIPHFEKMLYDNAFLIYIYSKASKIFENIDKNKAEVFFKIAVKTFEFLNKFLFNGNAYYSSLSAESNVDYKDQEGAYYLFTKNEIEKIDGFYKYFQDYQYFNHHTGYSGLIVHYKNFPLISHWDEIEEIVEKLREIRRNKQNPYLDNKIILSWNALLATYLLKSFKETNYEPFFENAKKLINFLIKNFFKNQDLYRLMVRDIYGKAVLEDYLWLSLALYQYYNLTKEQNYYDLSKEIFQKAKEKFFKNGVFYNSEDFQIFELFDNAIHSNNSLALMLGLFFKEIQNFETLILKIFNFEDKFLYLGSFLSFLCYYKFEKVKVLAQVSLQQNLLEKNLVNKYVVDFVNEGEFIVEPKQIIVEAGEKKKVNLKICDDKRCFEISKTLEL